MSDKRFKSLDDLCSLLVDERNLACRDRDELKRFLSRTNYYRFSGYAREFQIDPRYGDDRFNMSRTLSRGNEGPSQENLSRLGPFYHHPMISSDRLCHQTDARIRSLIFAG